MKSLYERFYCRDKETFFSLFVRNISEMYDYVDGPSQNFLKQYERELKLRGMDSNSVFRSDLERINDFDKLFMTYKTQLYPPVMENLLKDFEVILVGGFGSDFSRQNTFTDLDFVLKKYYGLSSDRLHYIFPNSFENLEAGMKRIEERISTLQQQNPSHKIILIGFSRGGLTSLAALIDKPKLLDAIHAIVTINSPLKGTSTAGAAEVALRYASKAAQWAERVGRKLGLCECLDDEIDFTQGAQSMHSHRTYDKIATLKNLSDDDYAKLSSHLFFISSSSFEEPTKVGTYVLDEENDGTVPISSQYLRSIGRRLAYLDNVGHTDLVMSGSHSNLTENERRAFARLLMDTIMNVSLFIDPRDK